MKKVFALALLLTVSQFVTAQVRQLEAGQSPGKGKVEDFSWMVGYWSGEGLGGECEEVWMPAKDGHMLGTFRLWVEGKLIFSEFMNLVQDGESVSMKLKHFSPDLEGWEEKTEWTTFKLVELSENKVWFTGLTIERKENQLLFSLALTENGVRKIEEFVFTRKAL